MLHTLNMICDGLATSHYTCCFPWYRAVFHLSKCLCALFLPVFECISLRSQCFPTEECLTQADANQVPINDSQLIFHAFVGDYFINSKANLCISSWHGMWAASQHSTGGTVHWIISGQAGFVIVPSHRQQITCNWENLSPSIWQPTCQWLHPNEKRKGKNQVVGGDCVNAHTRMHAHVSFYTPQASLYHPLITKWVLWYVSLFFRTSIWLCGNLVKQICLEMGQQESWGWGVGVWVVCAHAHSAVCAQPHMCNSIIYSELREGPFPAGVHAWSVSLAICLEISSSWI